ncbi:hypothetical protein MBANPS3_012355 [Mucor bainieri]
MAPLYASLSNYEKRMQEISEFPSKHVPLPLAKSDISKEYRSMIHAKEHGHEESIRGMEIADTVPAIGQQFVESILLSNEGYNVLITQIEVYYKDRSVDDTSINNVQLPNQDHEKRPVVIVERKTAQKSVWYELKLFYKKYELFVTGGVHGHADEDEFSCFLGSSKAPHHLMQQTHWIVIAPKSVVPFENDTRLLQSFRNRASRFRWAFKSKNFMAKGFHTASPLLSHQDRDTDYFALASYILECGSKGSITRSHLKQCRAMLYQMKFWTELGLKSKPSPNYILSTLEKDIKMGKLKKWMAEMAFSTPRDATNDELTALYKNFLYQKSRAIK